MSKTKQNEQTNELERKCAAIRQILQDGDETLTEALKLYDITEELYMDYMAKQIAKKYITAWDHQTNRSIQ